VRQRAGGARQRREGRAPAQRLRRDCKTAQQGEGSQRYAIATTRSSASSASSA
jgi:hypothetical protein